MSASESINIRSRDGSVNSGNRTPQPTVTVTQTSPNNIITSQANGEGGQNTQISPIFSPKSPRSPRHLLIKLNEQGGDQNKPKTPKLRRLASERIYDFHEIEIEELMAQLKSLSQNLDEHMSNVLKSQLNDFLIVYKSQMYKAKRDLKEQKERASERMIKAMQDKKVKNLETERDWFRGEALKLDAMTKQLMNYMHKMKATLKIIDQDRSFFQDQLLLTKKKNQALAFEVEKLKYVLEELGVQTTTGYRTAPAADSTLPRVITDTQIVEEREQMYIRNKEEIEIAERELKDIISEPFQSKETPSVSQEGELPRILPCLQNEDFPDPSAKENSQINQAKIYLDNESVETNSDPGDSAISVKDQLREALDKEKRYVTSMKNIQKQNNLLKKKVQQLSIQNAREANPANELKDFFTKCVKAVQKEIAVRRAASQPPSNRTVDNKLIILDAIEKAKDSELGIDVSELNKFTSTDQKRVMELLCSHEKIFKVLQLVYEEIFYGPDCEKSPICPPQLQTMMFNPRSIRPPRGILPSQRTASRPSTLTMPTLKGSISLKDLKGDRWILRTKKKARKPKKEITSKKRKSRPMGNGCVCTRKKEYIPLAVRRTSKITKDSSHYTLYYADFDNRILWFEQACEKLTQNKTIHTLTINFNGPINLTDSEALYTCHAIWKMINYMRLNHLILTGSLRLLEHKFWRVFWQNTDLRELTFEDRLSTKALRLFLYGHCINKHTECLTLKRNFHLADVILLIPYLNRNKQLKTLYLNFMDLNIGQEFAEETKEETQGEHGGTKSLFNLKGGKKNPGKSRGMKKSENSLSPPRPIRHHRKPKFKKRFMGESLATNSPYNMFGDTLDVGGKSTRLEDKMSYVSSSVQNSSLNYTPNFMVTGAFSCDNISCKPLAILAHNSNIKCLKMAGKLGTKICEYILGGMSLNSSVEEWIFKNITFTQASAKHLQLAISINRTLRQLTVHNGLNSASSMILFHALKDNKSITTLYLEACEFSLSGYTTLNECLKYNTTLTHLTLLDMNMLGATGEEPKIQVENFSLILEGLEFNQSIIYVTIKLNHSHYRMGEDQIVFDDSYDSLNSGFENLLNNNSVIQVLELENLRLKGRTLDAIAKGIGQNKTITCLNLIGSLMEWNLLGPITENIAKNEVLTKVDLKDNKLYRPSDLELISHRHYMMASDYMKDSLQNISNFQNITQFGVCPWFFDYTEYPDGIMKEVLEARKWMKKYNKKGENNTRK